MPPCIVMACTVMAYTVVTYSVMVYIVMGRRGSRRVRAHVSASSYHPAKSTAYRVHVDSFPDNSDGTHHSLQCSTRHTK